MRRATLLVTIALFPACIEADPDTVPTFGAATPDHELQGEELLGAIESLPSAVGYYAVDTTDATNPNGAGAWTATAAFGGLSISQGGTSFGGADQRLNGTELVSMPGGSRIRVLDGIPAGNGEPLRYAIEYLKPGGTSTDWVDPCNGELAIPLSGRYDDSYAHTADPGSITWSCEKGLAFKCSKWGFPESGDPTDDQWKVNQTCLRVAGFDSCYRGINGTREGTRISMWDRLGVKDPIPTLPGQFADYRLTTWPPPVFSSPGVGDFYLEAVWPEVGPVRCLSKRRWNSLPLTDGVGCPDIIEDPRTGSGLFCEDMTFDQITAADVDFITTSIYSDIAFDLWEGPNGDRLGTVRGFNDDVDPADHVDPRAGIPGLPMTWIGQNGVMLRAPTAEIDPLDIEQVNLYCKSGTGNGARKCVVTTPLLQPSTHTFDAGPEGWIFKTQGKARIPLRLYYNKTSGDYVSATTPQGFGYRSLGIMGYILPNAVD
jgi:hypothetical protein